MPSTCADCGAAIIVVINGFSGTQMQLEPEPDPVDGTVYVMDDGPGAGAGVELGGPLLRAARSQGLELWKRHECAV